MEKKMKRRLRKLQRRTMKQARRELSKGNLGYTDYVKVLDVVGTESGVRQLDAKIREARLNPYEGGDMLVGLDWKSVFANLWDWFKANWPAILKFILTIAPLLLLEQQRNEDS
jgi:hypothetical protein